MTTDVSNEESKQRMEHFDQVINPIGEEFSDKLNTKFLEAPTSKLLGEKYEILRRNQLNEKEIFSKDNIELNKKVDKLAMEISEIQGKLTASWEGEEVPLPELWPHLKSTDREVRKKASDSMFASELSVSEVIDDKFSELLKLRNQIASNAGFSSYTEYRFKDMQRFDWGVSDCTEFHAAVKKHILPLREKLLELRKKNLDIDTVKYYDTGVDISGRDPLQIYEKGNSELMVEGTEKIIKAIDGDLHEYPKSP